MAFASKNAFALLGDEDSSAPVAAPAPKVAPGAAVAAAATSGGASRNVPGSGRGAPRGNTRGGPRGAKSSDAPAANSDEAPQTRDSREPRRARGDGRGRGRGRGGRGRQFDRHSQTDRVDSDKAVSQAWGGEDGKRELKAEQDGVADADAENKPATNGASTPAAGEGDEAAPADAAAAPAEEVDNTKTLDEYLADLAAKKAALGAGKGAGPRTIEADEKSFGSKVVKNLEGDDYYASTKTSAAGRQRERKEKQILEIEQQFNTPPVQQRGGRGGARGGRGEGGRGRGEGRGRGGRGGQRGGQRGGSNANVNLNDQRAFPSLS